MVFTADSTLKEGDKTHRECSLYYLYIEVKFEVFGEVLYLIISCSVKTELCGENYR